MLLAGLFCFFIKAAVRHLAETKYLRRGTVRGSLKLEVYVMGPPPIIRFFLEPMFPSRNPKKPRVPPVSGASSLVFSSSIAVAEAGLALLLGAMGRSRRYFRCALRHAR